MVKREVTVSTMTVLMFLFLYFVYLFYIESSSDNTHIMIMKASNIYMTLKLMIQNSFMLVIHIRYGKHIISHILLNPVHSSL